MTQRPSSVLTLLVLSLVLVVGAFQFGQARAGASAKDGRRRTPVVQAVEHISRAVVSVDATYTMGRGYMGRSSGAGVIVHPDGYVVTNSHVVRNGTRLEVELFGKRGRLAARLVADDPGGDLAVLKVDGRGPFPYASLCPSRGLMLGETAIAIGNPHGLGDTITVGVVSAVGRSAKMQDGTQMRNLVQTDAAINTGNSGGPLINLDGELIGINVSVLPQAKGIAFAIGADQVQAILQRAMVRNAPRNALPEIALPDPSELALRESTPERERVSAKAAAPESPAPPAAKAASPLRPSDYGLEVADDGRRIVVRRVQADSSAHVAGLVAGDVVLSIDGHAIEDESDLILAFSATEPGRVYSLQARRGSEEKRFLLVTPR